MHKETLYQLNKLLMLIKNMTNDGNFFWSHIREDLGKLTKSFQLLYKYYVRPHMEYREQARPPIFG